MSEQLENDPKVFVVPKEWEDEVFSIPNPKVVKKVVYKGQICDAKHDIVEIEKGVLKRVISFKKSFDIPKEVKKVTRGLLFAMPNIKEIVLHAAVDFSALMVNKNYAYTIKDLVLAPDFDMCNGPINFGKGGVCLTKDLHWDSEESYYFFDRLTLPDGTVLPNPGLATAVVEKDGKMILDYRKALIVESMKLQDYATARWLLVEHLDECEKAEEGYSYSFFPILIYIVKQEAFRHMRKNNGSELREVLDLPYKKPVNMYCPIRETYHDAHLRKMLEEYEEQHNSLSLHGPWVFKKALVDKYAHGMKKSFSYYEIAFEDGTTELYKSALSAWPGGVAFVSGEHFGQEGKVVAYHSGTEFSNRAYVKYDSILYVEKGERNYYN